MWKSMPLAGGDSNKWAQRVGKKAMYDGFRGSRSRGSPAVILLVTPQADPAANPRIDRR